MHVLAALLLSAPATLAAAGTAVPPDTLVIAYVCGNTFRITNTYDFYYPVTWRVAGTEETGGFEAPRLREGRPPRPVYLTTTQRGTVEIHNSQQRIASARNRGLPACTIPADTVPLVVPWSNSFLPARPVLLYADSANPGRRFYGNYLAIQLDSTLTGAEVQRLFGRYGMTPLSERTISMNWPVVTTVRVASHRSWRRFTDFVGRVRADPRVANVAILQFDVAPPEPGEWTRLPGLPPMAAARRDWPQGGLEYFRVDLQLEFRPGVVDSSQVSWFVRNQVTMTGKVSEGRYFIRIPDPGPDPEQYIRAVARLRKDSLVRQLNPIPLGSVRLVPLTGIVRDKPTGRNVKGGEVCLTTVDPNAAQCGRVNNLGRFAIQVAPARAGILSWACGVMEQGRYVPSIMTRKWQAPFDPGEAPSAQQLMVATTGCDASAGNFHPLTRLTGVVTDSSSGRPFERSYICFSWQINATACAQLDTAGHYVLDSIPRIAGRIVVQCDSVFWRAHRALNDSLHPDTVSGALNFVLDASGCDPRQVRRERRTFTGLYSGAFEESRFVPCPSDSWLEPGDITWRGPSGPEAWVEWSRFPNPTPGDPKAWPRERAFPYNTKAFVHWYGTMVGPGTYGHMGMSPFEFRVDSIIEVRAIRKGDCGMDNPRALLE